MSKETGGPAFPSKFIDKETTAAYGGMTLRDWFAGQAIAGLCARHELPPNLNDAAVSAYVYHLADALIAERSKP